MRKIKIVTDSSANIAALANSDFASAPLKISSEEREFIDDENLNVDEMIEYFDTHKGKSKTSCPNPSDWIEAFGDADDIICLTITSGLSGSFNSARAAKDIYESENDGKRVFVFDTLTAGPEIELIAEHADKLIAENRDFEEICEAIKLYKKKTGLLFMLESLKNFAANGRISPAIAKITGLLGIRIVGKASDKGTLEPLGKCRGETKTLEMIITHLKEFGLSKGRVIISHCKNLAAASQLKEKIEALMPTVEVAISKCRGLCSYYAEKGGLLVGFENA